MIGYKVVDFGGVSRDIATEQTGRDGLYKDCKDALDCMIPIYDINMMCGSALSLVPVGSNFNRVKAGTGTNVDIELGAGYSCTIASDDDITFTQPS